MTRKKIFFVLLLMLADLILVRASPTGLATKGFEALRIYDYFKAKSSFEKLWKKKKDPRAAYGLAIIFLRQDNPFHSVDSAVKYANSSFHTYLVHRSPFLSAGYSVDSLSILQLADSAASKALHLAKLANSVAACDHFLKNNYLCRKKYIFEAVYLRDELEFNLVMDAYKSSSTRDFIITHPQSIFLKEAYILLERQIYDEMTRPGHAAGYIEFIEQHPKNVMVNTAYEKLFDIYKKNSDVKGLKNFVHQFPKAPQNLEAWKLFFSLTVKTYSNEELKKFIDDYPKFPLKNSILKDLELNAMELFPLGSGDYTGYVDLKGKWQIKPAYDEGSVFYEGLAVVSRNDSVFYINKENVNPFKKYYTDAYVFRNGIAAVKQSNKWYFINRQAQLISPGYDEINELSGDIYVVKSGDKYGAVDRFGQKILDPQFAKLGDFKNGHAYYQENSSYGFVSSGGSVYKAEFEWISDFNERQIAVFKQNGKFGLVNTKGKKLLDAEFDQVITAREKYFIVVAGGLYGFYSDEGCFMSPVIYEYKKEEPATFYTDSTYFKLLRAKDMGVMDANGKMVVPFGAYDDVGFPSQGLWRVKKRGKYGYVDGKFNTVIPFKYTSAGDFGDDAAIVAHKNKNALINLQGQEVYVTEAEIKKISRQYYFVDTDEGMLISKTGTVVLLGIEDYKTGENKIILTLSDGEIRLIND